LAVVTLLPKLPVKPAVAGPLWFIIFVPVCFACWPRSLSLIPKHWISSVGMGAAIFLLWIAPEVLIPGYRNNVVFSNSFFGHVHSSIPAEALRSSWVLAWRTARATLIVPIVEELFWRAWMLRWLINTDFQRIRLGTYAPMAFWLSALLFGSEHGPYWDVGLVTGIFYNWWMVRTKSVADCILMHATTNFVLSGYVIFSGNWQYWQ
jgi:CAAX prenyl protease-like protein